MLRARTGLWGRVRDLERRTRPVHPETAAALARRWAELPDHVRTPAQTLGQHAVGCEGTHGVFPRCDLACTPCYHSRDANRVRVDGGHTRTEVREQMALLRRLRGPRAHAQLIGGEVTLLPPDDHAATLRLMIDQGREPMSMTHGDFDEEYLQRLALGPDGRRRFSRLSFAGHFDSLMFGRRGIERPPDEAALHPYRQAFVDRFRRLRAAHGVRFFLAHNMTITPKNMDQIPEVIRACRRMGFGMFSFQPAAFIGDDRRWHEDYREHTNDEVWARIEEGVGTRLPYQALHTGDLRCNRTTYGFFVGDDYFPVLDERRPEDLRVRDVFFRHLGGVNFSGTPVPLLLGKLLRVTARHPVVLTTALGWTARMLRRIGLRRLVRHREIRSVSFVLHSFMDAADVRPAWEAMERGEEAADPRIAVTQQRLRACSYAMAHPETGRLVPACVQHSVLDPGENAELRRLLPLTVRRSPARPVGA
ncbi:hypothetical protein [Nakamurella endophytica]|uniref:Radical SAM domain-containing protein n=1 Tax=Nakamurella endophytica TaxID=1748367 RepID=A0A917SP92_9ACTN|nr:hypothetical protein [Nakamurella endophytica]GGL89056.1 hypothetical protein GCM10011594_05860 [Nakamurella endophytica]